MTILKNIDMYLIQCNNSPGTGHDDGDEERARERDTRAKQTPDR